MSTSLLRFSKINVGIRTLSLSASSLGPKGKKPKKGGKGGGGKNVTVEPLKAETVRSQRKTSHNQRSKVGCVLSMAIFPNFAWHSRHPFGTSSLLGCPL